MQVWIDGCVCGDLKIFGRKEAQGAQKREKGYEMALLVFFLWMGTYY